MTDILKQASMKLAAKTRSSSTLQVPGAPKIRSRNSTPCITPRNPDRKNLFADEGSDQGGGSSGRSPNPRSPKRKASADQMSPPELSMPASGLASPRISPSNLSPQRIRAEPPRPGSAWGAMMMGDLEANVIETSSINCYNSAGRDWVNQYSLISKIGHGSFGAVFLAETWRIDVLKDGSRCKVSNRVAMKCIGKEKLKKFTDEQTATKALRLQREITIMKKLNHPNCLKIMEVIDDSKCDTLYLVLELAERGDVMSDLEDDDCVEDVLEKVWNYFRDLIAALEYLHSMGIVHRDVKPENLLVNKHGHVLVADFGLSEIVLDDDLVSGVVGTMQYIPPEALLAKETSAKYRARAADVWAAGCTLYWLLFDQVPFNHKSANQTAKLIKDADLLLSEEVDPLINDLLRGMINKDPSSRMTLDDVRHHQWVSRNGEQPMSLPRSNRRKFDFEQFGKALEKLQDEPPPK